MSEALDRLKKLGAQKIYEDTHIPINQVQAILYENFDGMTKVQFVGFVSILEREYGEDLSETKEHGIAYFDEKQSHDDAEYAERIYVDPAAKKQKIILAFVLVLVLLLAAIYFTMGSAKETLDQSLSETNTTEVSQPTIQEEKSIAPVLEIETNTTQVTEQNTTKEAEKRAVTVEEAAKESEAVVKKEQAAPTSLKILPKTKVWLGYIDVKTNKKYQKTVKREFSLDPTKEWLLLFGHGYVTVVVGDQKYKFTKRDTLRLHYKDGKISQISEREFKRLNRGRKW